MRLNSKIKKTLTALTTVALMAPLVASVTTGSVYAMSFDRTDGKVPTVSTIVGQDGQIYNYNRPAYPNDLTTSNASFKNTIFPNNWYNSSLQTSNTVGLDTDSQTKTGAKIINKNVGALISGAGGTSLYSNPTMSLTYTAPDTTSNSEAQIKHKGFSAINSGIGKGGDVINSLTSSERSAYKKNVLNYTADWNKDGKLNLKYNYSVKITGFPSGIADQLMFLQQFLIYGLAFNAYVRVPDGYKAQDIVNAYDSTSYLAIDPGKSKASDTNKSAYNNIHIPLDGLDTANNRLLQVVDDHNLKLSFSSSTYATFTEYLYSYLMKQLKIGYIGNSYKPLFMNTYEVDLPIELNLNLDVNKISASGDPYDTSLHKNLTTKKKLPSIDNKTAINATFINGTSDSNNRILSFLTGKTLDPSVFKSSSFTSIDTNHNNSIITYNYAADSLGNDYKAYYTGGFYPTLDALNTSAIINSSGQAIADNNVYSLLKGVKAAQTTIKNVSTGVYSLNEFDSNNMDTNGGNAFSTWDEYISPYDTQGKYNNETSDEEMKMISSSVATDSLPGDDPTNRTVKFGSNDTFGNSNNLDPMRFYRSIDYFKGTDTTKLTKDNVAWVYTDASGKAIAQSGDPSAKDGIPYATTIKIDPRTSSDPNYYQPAGAIHYYGTDSTGNIMSPVTLNLERAPYDVPTVSGSSVVGKSLDDIKHGTIVNGTSSDPLIVNTGTTVYQSDTFSSSNINKDYPVKSQTVTMNIPSNVSLNGVNSVKVNGTDLDSSKYKVEGTKITILDDNGLTTSTSSNPTSIIVTYNYKINSGVADQSFIVGASNSFLGNLYDGINGKMLDGVKVSGVSEGAQLLFKNFTPPTFSTTSKVGNSNTDIIHGSDTDPLTVSTGRKVWQTDTFDITDIDTSYTINGQSVTLNLPANVTLDQIQSVTVGGKDITSSASISGSKVTFTDETTKLTKATPIAITYTYTVNSGTDQTKFNVGSTNQFAGTLHNNTTNLDLTSVTTKAPGAILLYKNAVNPTIVSVPAAVDFGELNQVEKTTTMVDSEVGKDTNAFKIKVGEISPDWQITGKALVVGGNTNLLGNGWDFNFGQQLSAVTPTGAVNIPTGTQSAPVYTSSSAYDQGSSSLERVYKNTKWQYSYNPFGARQDSAQYSIMGNWGDAGKAFNSNVEWTLSVGPFS